jgi:hypothetical protein
VLNNLFFILWLQQASVVGYVSFSLFCEWLQSFSFSFWLPRKMMVHGILVFSIDQDGFDFLVVVHADV